MDISKKIDSFIEKQGGLGKIYLKPGEQPPKGAQILRGRKGGSYYIGTGRQGLNQPSETDTRGYSTRQREWKNERARALTKVKQMVRDGEQNTASFKRLRSYYAISPDEAGIPKESRPKKDQKFIGDPHVLYD